MIVKCTNIFAMFVGIATISKPLLRKTLLQTILQQSGIFSTFLHKCLFVCLLVFFHACHRRTIESNVLLLQPSDHNSEVFSLSSQGSAQECETSQEWQVTPQVEHKLQSLNNFVRRTSDRSVSPVRSQCKSDVLTISASTQRYYRRKAEQVVDVVLDAIAPSNSMWLFEQVHSRHEYIQAVSSAGEGTLVSRLIICYEEAGSWYNRQQILSLFAGDYSKTELLQMIPGLTKWRIDEARKHAFKNKPGQLIEPPILQRTRLDPVKVDHFLDFISSPSFLQDVAYGTRNLKLSTRKKIEIPSVVRTVISSRLVQLYLKYCAESAFEPLTHFLQILCLWVLQKTLFFRFPPNLAHRKLIDLANYIPSSSPWGGLSFTQRFF